MAPQPALDPFLRRHVQRDAAAMRRFGDDALERAALEFLRRLAGQLRILRIAGEKTVLRIEESEGIGRQLDRLAQPGDLMARGGDVGPQENRIAVGRAARLDFDDAPVGQRHVARFPGAGAELIEAAGDEGFHAAGQGRGRDFLAVPA